MSGYRVFPFTGPRGQRCRIVIAGEDVSVEKHGGADACGVDRWLSVDLDAKTENGTICTTASKWVQFVALAVTGQAVKP